MRTIIFTLGLMFAEYYAKAHGVYEPPGEEAALFGCILMVAMIMDIGNFIQEICE